MSSKGSAQDGLKFVTRVRALLRVAARPMTSALTCEAFVSAAVGCRKAPRLGDEGGLSLKRSKREEVGLGGGVDFKMSKKGTDAAGSIDNPVIGVLNLPLRARLNAVVPSRAFIEEASGRMRAGGAEGA
jgi:hypothetical protein